MPDDNEIDDVEQGLGGPETAGGGGVADYDQFDPTPGDPQRPLDPGELSRRRQEALSSQAGAKTTVSPAALKSKSGSRAGIVKGWKEFSLSLKQQIFEAEQQSWLKGAYGQQEIADALLGMYFREVHNLPGQLASLAVNIYGSLSNLGSESESENLGKGVKKDTADARDDKPSGLPPAVLSASDAGPDSEGKLPPPVLTGDDIKSSIDYNLKNDPEGVRELPEAFQLFVKGAMDPEKEREFLAANPQAVEQPARKKKKPSPHKDAFNAALTSGTGPETGVDSVDEKDKDRQPDREEKASPFGGIKLPKVGGGVRSCASESDDRTTPHVPKSTSIGVSAG